MLTSSVVGIRETDTSAIERKIPHNLQMDCEFAIRQNVLGMWFDYKAEVASTALSWTDSTIATFVVTC